MESKTAVTVKKEGAFSSIQSFEDAQRMAAALCKSTLVPKAYQNNVPNTIVALEMSNRIGISPFMVMQNLDIIQGKPSWRSTFIISALNMSGKFSPLRFKWEGEKGTDKFGCRATAKDSKTGEEINGPLVSWLMVKSEGWLSKAGSKWKTMPELMFQYRAASFFGRLFAPEILTGMQTVDEIVDSETIDVQHTIVKDKREELNDLFDQHGELLTVDEQMHIERILEDEETLSYSKAIVLIKSKTLDGAE